MKKESIIQTISKKDFRKLVNYYLNGRGEVTTINTFKSNVVIFNVVTFKNNSLFHLDSSFSFMGAFIKNDQIHSTWYLKVENLKYLINTIDFFNRSESHRIKMNFPVITLKNKLTIQN